MIGTNLDFESYSKFGVMEDDNFAVEKIMKSLKEYGSEGIRIKDSKNAIEYLNKGIKNYILDVDMGEKRHTEGLLTLRSLKKRNENVFVGILTQVNSDTEDRAQRLGADIYVKKSDDLETDVIRILYKKWIDINEISVNKREIFENELVERIGYIEFRREFPLLSYKKISKFKRKYRNIMYNNIKNYSTMISNPSWFNKHKGSYVCIIDGEIKGIDSNRKRLARKMSEEIPNKFKLILKVEKRKKEVLDLPSIFEDL